MILLSKNITSQLFYRVWLYLLVFVALISQKSQTQLFIPLHRNVVYQHLETTHCNLQQLKMNLIKQVFHSFTKSSPTLITYRSISTKSNDLFNPLKIIPLPCEKVPNVNSFLSALGRGFASAYASRFNNDWNSFFSSTGQSFEAMSIPPRHRRYLLKWMELYRQGTMPYNPLMSAKIAKRKIFPSND